METLSITDVVMARLGDMPDEDERRELEDDEEDELDEPEEEEG